MNYFWALFFGFLTTLIPSTFLIFSIVLIIPKVIMEFLAKFFKKDIENFYQLGFILVGFQIIFEIYGYLLGIGTSFLILKHFLDSKIGQIISLIIIFFFYIRAWVISSNQKKVTNQKVSKDVEAFWVLFVQPIFVYVILVSFILFYFKSSSIEPYFSWLFDLLKFLIPDKSI